MVEETVSEDNLSFRREYPWVKWAKIGVDILALQFSLYLGFLLRQIFSPWFPVRISIRDYHTLILGMLLVPVCYWLVGLYPGYGLTGVERLRRRVSATFIFLVLFISWDFLVNHAEKSRGILLFSFVFALVIPPVMQAMARSVLIPLNCWGTPVVVLGAARTGQYVVQSLIKNPDLGFRPVAIFDDDHRKAGKTIDGVPVIHGLLRANELAGRVQYVLLAIPGAGGDFHVKLSHKLNFSHIIIIPDLIGMQSLWVEARDLGGIVGLEMQRKLLLRRNRYIKLVMDYMLGVPLLILSIPIFLFFALWIMMVSPGNPFYYQEREGRSGVKIKVWKLRTMYPDAEKLLQKYLEVNPKAGKEWISSFKLKDDPRVLKVVGNFLRKSSLDELPQLWNVIRGEMSLVGPRPFPQYHLDQFDSDFCKLRSSVIPGMTGLWQVSARSDSDLVMQENLDTYYIRNWSIWLDLSLLGRTAMIVLTGKGAY